MNDLDFTSRQIEIMEAAINLIDSSGIQELTIKNLSKNVGVTEAALYRHFANKDEILQDLLMYALDIMSGRLIMILNAEYPKQILKLEEVFKAQLEFFSKKSAIVSVIFSEGIFQFNSKLSSTVSLMMEVMYKHINNIIKKGQSEGSIRGDISDKIITDIIMGSMRITVLKWKISGHKTNLVQNGKTILNGIIKMIDIN